MLRLGFDGGLTSTLMDSSLFGCTSNSMMHRIRHRTGQEGVTNGNLVGTPKIGVIFDGTAAAAPFRLHLPIGLIGVFLGSSGKRVLSDPRSRASEGGQSCSKRGVDKVRAFPTIPFLLALHRLPFLHSHLHQPCRLRPRTAPLEGTSHQTKYRSSTEKATSSYPHSLTPLPSSRTPNHSSPPSPLKTTP